MLSSLNEAIKNRKDFGQIDATFHKLVKLGIMEMPDKNTIRFTDLFCHFVEYYSEAMFNPEDEVTEAQFKAIITAFNLRGCTLSEQEITITMNTYISMIMIYDIEQAASVD